MYVQALAVAFTYTCTIMHVPIHSCTCAYMIGFILVVLSRLGHENALKLAPVVTVSQF